jgi:hypothetical protein
MEICVVSMKCKDCMVCMLLQERRRQVDESDRAELLMRLKGDDVARTMAEERGYDPEVFISSAHV